MSRIMASLAKWLSVRLQTSRFSQTPCQKNELMIPKTSYCYVLDKGNGLGKVYCVKKIQVLLCSTPIATGIIQFMEMSISKTTFKNFKEV